MGAPVAGQDRLGGLRRFAIAITILNILGHTVFGFEQSWAQPFAALATAYSLEFLLEWVGSQSSGRLPAYQGSFRRKIDFLLSAHISGLAVSMLLYTNERLWPTAFATAVAIGSKAIFRTPAAAGGRHFFNPSNFGISVTLLCFSWVGISPPYMFTENLDTYGDWILPAIIICSGSFLNWRFTHRLPLIATWLSAFVLQALVRNLIFGSSFTAGLGPMTGLAFVLYTFYMVTDPATTPSGKSAQILFGASVAATYGFLMAFHVVFGLFFALSIVCAVRGLSLCAEVAWSRWLAMRPRMVAAAAHGD